MIDFDDPFPAFPKTRPQLPDEYLEIYERELLINRSSGSLANRVAAWLESWMHRRVAACGASPSSNLLEIGAGSLNHLFYEKAFARYDVVEPNNFLIGSAPPSTPQPSDIYRDLSEIPSHRRYDRIFSVAVLEHLCDLPRVVARSALMLNEGGQFAAGIPSEGACLWEFAWRYGTGPGFKRRTGLDYAPMMRFEHVNQAPEILAVVRHFFETVKVARFPIPLFDLSLYSVLVATNPRKDQCAAILEARASVDNTSPDRRVMT